MVCLRYSPCWPRLCVAVAFVAVPWEKEIRISRIGKHQYDSRVYRMASKVDYSFVCDRTNTHMSALAAWLFPKSWDSRKIQLSNNQVSYKEGIRTSPFVAVTTGN